MRTAAAAAGSPLFFAAAPGVVAGVVPYGGTAARRSPTTSWSTVRVGSTASHTVNAWRCCDSAAGGRRAEVEVAVDMPAA